MSRPAPTRRPAGRRWAALLTSAALTLGGAGVLAPTPAMAVDAVPGSAKAKFIAQADQICAAGKVRLRARVEQYESRKQGGATAARKVATPGDVARFVNDVAAAEIARQIKELSALRPPAGDATAVKKILDSARAALVRLEKNPQRAAFDNPFAEVARQFTAYGITECASSDLPAQATGAS